MARLRAWLRAFPLQRRVAYLTTIAVALAVADQCGGYLTLRISLHRALDAEMARRPPRLVCRLPRHSNPRRSHRGLRAATSASQRSEPTARSSRPDERDHLVLGAEELAVLGCRAATRRGPA